MSFGYSVGDFIAGANMSYRLIRAMSETQGACLEYQEAIMELSSLQQTFLEVGHMRPNSTVSRATINAAAQIVLPAVTLIGNFLEKTKRFRDRLSGAEPGSMVSDSWQKMGWTLFRKEELKALKDDLHLRLTSIGVLFSTAQIHGKIPECVAQYEVKEHSPEEYRLPGNTATIEPAKEKPMQQAGNLQLESLAPLKFKDAVGRKFSFPFHLCSTWRGMAELINDIFKTAEFEPQSLAAAISQEYYDLVGPEGSIILPLVWGELIEPGWSISMQMWPLPEAAKPASPTSQYPSDSSDDDADDDKEKSSGAMYIPGKRKRNAGLSWLTGLSSRTKSQKARRKKTSASVLF